VAPHVYAAKVYERATSKPFDNTRPRSLTSTIKEDQSVSKADKDLVIRAEGCQQNGFENVGIFAAAVVAANVAKLDVGYLNMLSWGYIASRVVYTYVYLNNTSLGFAYVRSVVFVGGVGLCMTMFVSAANVLRLGSPA